MNYRHIYHAGDFADVFKHIVIIMLLQSLLQKAKPFVYIDTHAGIGCYDLQQSEAQKTKAYETGISQIIKYSKEINSNIIDTYLNIIKKYNTNYPLLQNYPGSPAIAQALLRSEDQIILSELQRQDCHTLKQFFWKDHRASVHCMDGYEAVKAFVPPTPNRGLILIDPPYENVNEYENIISALKIINKRWVNGIVAIWYPVTSEIDKRQKLIMQLKNLAFKNILQTELNILSEDSPMGLNGSGMIVINPPWQFGENLTKLLPELWKILSPEKLGKCFVTTS